MADAKTEKLKAEARAQTRLAKIAAGKAQQRPAVWPQLDAPVLLKVLSNEDIQVCHAAAIRRFADLDVPYDSLVTANLFEDEVITQVLAQACRDPEKPELGFAEDADDLRAHTTNSQRVAMFEIYRDWVAEVDPPIESLTPDIVAEIVDAIKKKDSASLKRFGSSVLASFLLSSVSPPSSSPNGSSATG